MCIPNATYWYNAWLGASDRITCQLAIIAGLAKERDSHKDAVDKAHAAIDENGNVGKRGDNHRSLPERVGQLLKQLENQACTIRDQCTPVSEREQRALHELIELREANARLATALCDARKDRDNAQLQCYELNAHEIAVCRERDSAQTQLAVARTNYNAAQADAERYWKLILDTAAALGKTIPGDMSDLPGWTMHLKGELIQTQKELQRVREANGVLVEAQKTCDPVLQRAQTEVIARQQNDIAFLRREIDRAQRVVNRYFAIGDLRGD